MNNTILNMDETFRKLGDIFCIEGTYLRYEQMKNGNVNQTYKVTFLTPEGKEKSYIAQRVNTYVFKNPDQVMNNIDLVTECIRRKKPGQVALHFHHTKDRKTYFIEGNDFWRMMNYVDSVTYNSAVSLDVLRNTGAALGDFQMQLADFDASQLFETIPDFHNTRKRYETLEADVQKDVAGRVQEVQPELNYLASVKEKACTLCDLLDEGKIPLRVTHNDTKINNVLFDKDTAEPLVIIDLDTVMPGLAGYDFGDAIRFGANEVEEDCKEAEKACLNLDAFRAFAEGFLSQTCNALTAVEIETLPISVLVLTAELATRFLDDYINGDVYFKNLYPGHNLVRTRCQIALAKDVERKLPQMMEIVEELQKKFQRCS